MLYRYEWGQGFMLNYASGFSQGTVGFGVDALGLLGVRLDGGGTDIDRQPGTIFPLESDGSAVDEFSSLGMAAKAKVSKTEMRYGTLQPKLPVVVSNDARLLPMTYEGDRVTSRAPSSRKTPTSTCPSPTPALRPTAWPPPRCWTS